MVEDIPLIYVPTWAPLMKRMNKRHMLWIGYSTPPHSEFKTLLPHGCREEHISPGRVKGMSKTVQIKSGLRPEKIIYVHLQCVDGG